MRPRPRVAGRTRMLMRDPQASERTDEAVPGKLRRGSRQAARLLARSLAARRDPMARLRTDAAGGGGGKDVGNGGH